MDILNIATAKDPNTSPKILDRLSYDEDYFVRFWVSYNTNTLPETLDRLANDEVWFVPYGFQKIPKHLNTLKII